MCTIFPFLSRAKTNGAAFLSSFIDQRDTPVIRGLSIHLKIKDKKEPAEPAEERKTWELFTNA